MDVSHIRVVYELQPTKAERECTRITIGGNTIGYTGDCGTKTGSLKTVKLVINSTLSTPGAPEYLRIKFDNMPQEIMDEYTLEKYTHNGWVYFELSW